jgi:alpha-glucoside transport system substrate-binding protein
VRRLAEEIRDPAHIAFDLSDRLTGGLAGGDGQGLWRILAGFFEAVAVNGRRPEDAVPEAVAALRQAAAPGRP